MTDEHRDATDLPGDVTADDSALDGADLGEQVDRPEAGAGVLARQHPVVVYTLLRLAILAACGAVFYLLGARGVWLILFAFLVSGLISGFVLRRPREGAVLGLTSAYSGINARMDARTRAEDHDDDLDEPPAQP